MKSAHLCCGRYKHYSLCSCSKLTFVLKYWWTKWNLEKASLFLLSILVLINFFCVRKMKYSSFYVYDRCIFRSKKFSLFSWHDLDFQSTAIAIKWMHLKHFFTLWIFWVGEKKKKKPKEIFFTLRFCGWCEKTSHRVQLKLCRLYNENFVAYLTFPDFKL